MHGAGSDEATSSEDRDPICDLLHLREDVARDEHGPTLGAEAPQEVAHLHDPGGVEAVGGLIEDQQRGILEQRRGDAEALLHPQRIGPDHVVRAGREARRDRAPDRRHRERCRRSSPRISRLRLPVNLGKSIGASTIEPTRWITRERPCGTSLPRRRARPAEAETSPRRHRIVVVLPAPFGPRNPKTPPSETSRSSPSRATVGGLRNRRYSLRSPSISITAAIALDRTRVHEPGTERALELLPSGGQPARGERAPVDPNHEILFEPVQIGPKTLRNRFYQVPHCSGFGTEKPWTQAAHRGVKAEGGWAAVCTEYAPFSPDSDEAPLIAARFWDEDDMRALRLMTDAAHEHGALAGLELYHGGAHIANNQTRLPSVAPSQLASDLEPHVVPKEMEPRGHREGAAPVGGGRDPRSGLRIRHRLRVRRPRVSSDAVPLALLQQADRRIRRAAEGPGAVLARDARPPFATRSARTAPSRRGSRSTRSDPPGSTSRKRWNSSIWLTTWWTSGT